MSNILKGLQLNELSNEKLGKYKTAAGADATAADKAGDYKRGDKRMRGITNATKKEFVNDKKKLKEFAADDGDGGEEDTLRKYAKMWYNGDDSIQQQVEQILDRMGWEIGELESEEGGAFVIQPGDENGDTYIGFTATDLTDEVDEAYNNYHANRTGFTRPKRDLSGEGEPQGMFMVMIDGRPWKEFTSNVAFARAKTLADKNPTKKIQVRWPTGELNTVKGNVDEGRYDSDDYYNPRMSRDYGARNLHTDSGAYEFEKNVPAGEPGGERGRPSNLKGISKALPADAFGRTTGKIPKGKPGTVHSMMRDIDEDELDENCWKGYHKEGNKELFGKTVPNCVKNESEEVDEADMSRRGFLKGMGTAAAGAGAGIAGYRYLNPPPKSPQEIITDAIKSGKWSLKAYRNARNEGYSDEEIADYLTDYKGQVYTKFKQEEPPAPTTVINTTKESKEQHSCPHCGGEMVSEELMNEKKDACYYKVKSRYKVWPSAYASGALVKCRKKGADSWGNGGKKNESSILEGIERADENLHQWFKEKWVRFGPDGKIRGDCARGDDSEGKPKCLPQSKAHSLGKKGRASAAARKRREDPNPERSGPAINVNTKKKSNEAVLDEKWSQKYKNSINCSNPKGFSQKAHCQGKKK